MGRRLRFSIFQVVIISVICPVGKAGVSSCRVCCVFVVVIDMDGRIYARAWHGGILSGGFEKNPKPIFTEGRNQLEIQNMQEDWDHFGELNSHAQSLRQK